MYLDFGASLHLAFEWNGIGCHNDFQVRVLYSLHGWSRENAVCDNGIHPLCFCILEPEI